MLLFYRKYNIILQLLLIIIFFYWVIYNIYFKKEEERFIKYKNIVDSYNDIDLGSNYIKGFASVIDGDSIMVNNKKIRLAAIDAAELDQKCFKKEIIKYDCGNESYKFLKNIVHKKHIKCYYNNKDIYNRYLGKCFVKNININEEILKNGMAIIYNFTTSSNRLKNFELQARGNKLGLWRGSFLEPKKYRQLNK